MTEISPQQTSSRQTSSRRAYPSDMTNLQWRFIETILPAPAQTGRHRSIDLREVVNAIHYRWRTGCVWRMLPHDYPMWTTVYSYFRSWQAAGILPQLREILIRKRLPSSRSDKPITRLDPSHKHLNRTLDRALDHNTQDKKDSLQPSLPLASHPSQKKSWQPNESNPETNPETDTDQTEPLASKSLFSDWE